jgi:hypothetical protein
VRKLLFITFLSTLTVAVLAQETTSTGKKEKKAERLRKVSDLIKQSEEGVLVYHKQHLFGIQGRSNGYGIFYELGKMKTNYTTNLYRIDITEIKSQKEEKSSKGFFSNTFIYGKLNNFYQASLSFGQQRILGQKGNKNGVAVTAVYNGGLALGLLRPYYLEVQDPTTGENKFITYSKADSALFLNSSAIVGRGGLFKGFNEMKLKPGVFAKAALRFDYGRFNETVTGIEIGLSTEFYAQKVPIYFGQKEKQLFFQGYIALLFGQRK